MEIVAPERCQMSEAYTSTAVFSTAHRCDWGCGIVNALLKYSYDIIYYWLTMWRYKTLQKQRQGETVWCSATLLKFGTGLTLPMPHTHSSAEPRDLENTSNGDNFDANSTEKTGIPDSLGLVGNKNHEYGRTQKRQVYQESSFDGMSKRGITGWEKPTAAPG